MTAPAVEVRGLVKEFGSRRVLDVQHFAVVPGSVCAVVGPNGSGKTTLLSILALLEPPSSGSVALFGEDVSSSRTDARRLRRRMVMVHEEPWMFHTSALGNVAYGLSARGVDRRLSRERAAGALETVGMSHAAAWPAPRLSAGEKRRVAIARALAIRPELLLLDEPLADVDAASVMRLERIIRELPCEGTTVLVATHRLDIALGLTDRCVGLMSGAIAEALPGNHFVGTIEEEDGEPVVRLGPRCTVRLATPLRGPAHVMIDPRTIILSRSVPPSSARNHFPGRITALAVEGECVRVTVDVGVPMTALITERSSREMHLHLGEEVSVLFKAVSLAVYGGRTE